MSKGTKSERVINITQSDDRYPVHLKPRLQEHAPKSIWLIGKPNILRSPLTALLCSQNAPGSTILRTFDQAAYWRDSGTTVIGGFHSPMEQECLEILLRGKQTVVVATARAILPLRLPLNARKALDEGRLTVISSFDDQVRRTTAANAQTRNLLCCALAKHITFAHIRPTGSLDTLRSKLHEWQTQDPEKAPKWNELT
jgi:predicted Rossmann fold nucleotide-binding protein DprA/Smf involved in DNA uptake